MTVVSDHLCGKSLKRYLVCKIADKIIVREQVNDAYRCARRLKLLADALADAPCTAGYDGDLIFEIEHITHIIFSSMFNYLIFSIRQS